MPVPGLTQEQIDQFELSPTLSWIGITPSHIHHSSTPWHLEEFNDLLNPCRFESEDVIESYEISTPEPEMALSVANVNTEIEQAQAEVASAKLKVAELNLARAEEAQRGAMLQKEADDLLSFQKEQSRLLEEAVASAAATGQEDGARDAARDAAGTPVDTVDEEYDDLDVSVAASEAGSSVRPAEPCKKKRKDNEAAGEWLGMEVTEEVQSGEHTAFSGSGGPPPPMAETRAGGEETREDTLAVGQAWLNKMFESSQLALNRNIENQMGPMMAALREMRVNVAMKSDLEIFKMEIRQEVDARLSKEAQGKTKESAKTDPFTKQDPWKPGAWDKYQATGASSSGPAHADQGGTSQIPHGKWHPDGETAKTAVGAAAGNFQQQQQVASGSSEFVPSQVFIRGWSNWGDTNGISKTRAAEIWNNIKKQLSADDERLVINWTVFDPIQRIAIHVMELPGVATHTRDNPAGSQ